VLTSCAVASKANDSEVIATSINISLKCPLSYMRLQLPCRGISCSHIQCFDATSYLQLQEQGPQWLCPICNKSTPFDQLAVDECVFLPTQPGLFSLLTGHQVCKRDPGRDIRLARTGHD